MMSPVTKNLVIINTIMLIATWIIGDTMYEKLALFAFESPFFKPYQLITHMFMHGDFWHLFFNMYTLMIFGTVLERIWGSKKFLLFYFVTGIGAALCHSLVLHLQYDAFVEAGKIAAATAVLRTPTVGASGAIYGVLLGYGMLFPDNRLQLIFPPVAMKAKWFVIIFGAIELITGLTGMGGNIAHFAHLGGMLFGLIMILIWKKQNRLYH
ncbi:MAG: rhomboid family intramembrane serine protease [Bacteroidales bacterium]|nr:rhomboid family intramembrane serine protease [Bacteroidales bacterium]